MRNQLHVAASQGFIVFTWVNVLQLVTRADLVLVVGHNSGGRTDFYFGQGTAAIKGSCSD